MTSDMGEMFNEWRDAKKDKRASNRENSAQLLRDAGISFVSKNDGAHLVVAGRYDFWPGTGLWMARGDRSKRRGVQALIQRVNAKEPK